MNRITFIVVAIIFSNELLIGATEYASNIAHSRASRYIQPVLEPLKSTHLLQKPPQSAGITLDQLLAFTNGLLPTGVVEHSFRLADKDGNGHLDDKEIKQASIISNQLTQQKIHEELSEAEKNADGLIELDGAKLFAHQLGIADVDSELSAVTDKSSLLTTNVVERVLNTNPSGNPLHAVFAQFDDDSDGNLSREEIDRFICVMHLDKEHWIKAMKAASLHNNTLYELTFDDLERVMQSYK